MQLKCSKIAILIVILLFFFLIFISINKLAIGYAEQRQILNNEKIYSNEMVEENNFIQDDYLIDSKNKQTSQVNNNENNINWSLKIKKINLEANISEGTDSNILNNSIGHFPETSKLNGNIGLAAHNRGYKNNYFEKIDQLESGDKIDYYYNGNIKHYEVKNKVIILNTDWKYLLRENKNKLTLITCIKNQPKYRLCVQAVEV